jgi:hypothetical protein
MRLRAAEVEEAVLRAVEEHVLRPERIEAFLLAVEAEDTGEQRKALEREASALDKSAARLVRLAEQTDDVTALAARLRAVEARRKEVAAALNAAQPVPRLPAPVIKSRLTEWRHQLRGNVRQARAVLERVLAGRLLFTQQAGAW